MNTQNTGKFNVCFYIIKVQQKKQHKLKGKKPQASLECLSQPVISGSTIAAG